MGVLRIRIIVLLGVPNIIWTYIYIYVYMHVYMCIYT